MSAGYTIPQQTDEQVLDLVRSTFPKVLKRHGKDFTVICQKYQKYYFAKMLANDAGKLPVDNTSFTWPVVYKVGTSARHDNPAAQDAVSVENVSKLASDTLVHMDWNVSWIRQEVLGSVNSANRLFNMLDTRYASEQLGALDAGESKLWDAPSTTEEAKTIPKGIPYWVQRGSSATPSFQGGNPSGFSAGRGNIDSTVVTDWKNYAGQYVLVSDDDLVENLRIAVLDMDFEKPEAIADKLPDPESPDPNMYMNRATKLALMAVGRDNNESLGWDLHGKTPVFYGHEFKYVPYLNDDSTNPVYLVDMNDFRLAFLEGDFLHMTGPNWNSSRHNIMSVFWDLTYQYVPMNLRLHGVLALAS